MSGHTTSNTIEDSVLLLMAISAVISIVPGIGVLILGRLLDSLIAPARVDFGWIAYVVPSVFVISSGILVGCDWVGIGFATVGLWLGCIAVLNCPGRTLRPVFTCPHQHLASRYRP